VAAFGAIVRLTALETVRRPVFLVVTLCGLAGTALMPFFLHYTLGDAPRMIRDSSLALLYTGGLLLAAWSAVEGLGGEMRRGTAGVALAKPVGRGAFLVAKAAGVALAMAGHAAASLAATLLAVRAGAVEWHLDWTAEGPALVVFPVALGWAAWRNRRSGRPFASAACAGLWIGFGAALAVAACRETPLEHLGFPGNLDWAILQAGALACLPMVMAVAAATALAVRLGTVPVLMGCAALFAGGLMADSLLGPHLEASFWARAAYAVLPNGQAFWLTDALDAGRGIPAAYAAGAVAYAAVWSAACLVLGAGAFRRAEVG
jgi:hypothetical protein